MRQTEERIRKADVWDDNDLIFGTQIGTQIGTVWDPSKFRREFSETHQTTDPFRGVETRSVQSETGGRTCWLGQVQFAHWTAPTR